MFVHDSDLARIGTAGWTLADIGQFDDRTSRLNEGKLRVLIVEDEAMLAIALEQDLIDAGYAPVGPFRNLESARRAAAGEAFDIAILDINLNGERAYPVAEDLSERGIPFFFLTGYGAESIPEAFRDCPRLAKPYDPSSLDRILKTLTSGA